MLCSQQRAVGSHLLWKERFVLSHNAAQRAPADVQGGDGWECEPPCTHTQAVQLRHREQGFLTLSRHMRKCAPQHCCCLPAPSARLHATFRHALRGCCDASASVRLGFRRAWASGPCKRLLLAGLLIATGQSLRLVAAARCAQGEISC